MKGIPNGPGGSGGFVFLPPALAERRRRSTGSDATTARTATAAANIAGVASIASIKRSAIVFPYCVSGSLLQRSRFAVVAALLGCHSTPIVYHLIVGIIGGIIYISF
jgi:hypothetical protein